MRPSSPRLLRRRLAGGAPHQRETRVIASLALGQRGGEDRRTPLADRGEHVLGRVGHEDLGVGGEGHDGIGGRLDGEDEIWVEVEGFGLATESAQTDHSQLIGICSMGLSAKARYERAPWEEHRRAVRRYSD